MQEITITPGEEFLLIVKGLFNDNKEDFFTVNISDAKIQYGTLYGVHQGPEIKLELSGRQIRTK